MTNEKGFLVIEAMIVLLVITVMTSTFISFTLVATEKMREKKEELEFLTISYAGAKLCTERFRCSGRVDKEGVTYNWVVRNCSVIVERDDGRRKVIACEKKKG